MFPVFVALRIRFSSIVKEKPAPVSSSSHSEHNQIPVVDLICDRNEEDLLNDYLRLHQM